jgi:hypothetical protein
VDIPIACSLTATAARSQLDEWRTLLATAAVAAERVSPSRLSLRLRDDLGQVGPVIALAQREKACCPFFDFTIQIDADRVTLHISVPAEAAGVLDSFESDLRGAAR